MAICKMSMLLQKASAQNKAVGAFNVFNMEMLMGVIKAAEKDKTDVIIQIAEKRLGYSPIDLIAPMMVSSAKKAEVNIAVQLDHGYTKSIMQQVKDYGFTSVMYDGSALDIEDNIKQTSALVKWAFNNNLDLEAEVGVLAGNEGAGEMTSMFTDPKEAALLAEKTNCTALAVSIGNAHGHYQGKPKLNFEVLEKINSLIPIPLVLHGGTGIPAEDFYTAISLGVRKINVATANMDSCVSGVVNYLASKDNPNYFELSTSMVNEVYESVREHINIFNNKR